LSDWRSDHFYGADRSVHGHRIPAADKAARPPRELRIGPDVLASLSSLEGVDRTKVIAVTVEIITDLVNELCGRELHPL